MFKKNSHRIAYYEAGDIIAFKIKSHPDKIREQILRFEDSLIVFRLFKVNPKEVTHLYIDNKTKTWFIFRYKYEKILPIMGAGYILLDWINTGEVTKETLVIGGSFIAGGLVAKALIRKRMKIRGSRRLIILASKER